MTISQKYLEFINLVQALNTIVFGDDTAEVTLDGITKPSISKFLAQVDALTTAELQRLRDAINIIMNQQGVPTTTVTDGTHSQEWINSNFRAALQALNDWIGTKGFANGIAPLDTNVKVDPIYLPRSTETTFGVAKIATTAIAQAGTNDTDTITAKKLRGALNASGNAPCYAARAFVTFNASTGTPVISASGNVSSITDNGIGDFTVNFTTVMPDANYAVAGVTGNDNVTNNPAAASIRAQTGAITTTSCRVRTANHFINSGAAVYDMPYNSVIVFR